MAIIQFHTEKGNVSVKARSAVKAQVVSMLQHRIGADLFVCDKGLAMEVGTDERGEPIYFVIDPTITQTLEVKAKAPKAKADAPVFPSIFE